MTLVKLTAGGAHGSQLFRVLDGPGQPLGQLFGVVVLVDETVHALGDEPGGAGVLRHDGGLAEDEALSDESRHGVVAGGADEAGTLGHQALDLVAGEPLDVKDVVGAVSGQAPHGVHHLSLCGLAHKEEGCLLHGFRRQQPDGLAEDVLAFPVLEGTHGGEQRPPARIAQIVVGELLGGVVRQAVDEGPDVELRPQQPFPWIDIRDLCRAMAFFIENEELRGVFNLVAPQAVSQSTFTHAMGKAYHAWTTLIVPQAVFRLFYGEAASFLTAGQRVRPTRLLEAGFHFSVPTIEKLFEGTDHSTVDRLDLKRYMGLWYEIARYDHRFERGLTEVTATYTLRPDGTIRVENRGYKRNSPYDICKTATGHAKIPDPAQPGKLKVSFFLNFYSDYYVMELDQENYNYALIGSSTDKYLWILSRTPQLPEDIKKKLVTAAERRGYDTNRLQWIEQL